MFVGGWVGRFHITADLPASSTPSHNTLRPDIVMWSTLAIYLLELMIPFETNIAVTVERKVHC